MRDIISNNKNPFICHHRPPKKKKERIKGKSDLIWGGGAEAGLQKGGI